MSQAPTPNPSGPARNSAAELAIALAIVGIVLMMVIPLPGVLVDAMLAISLAVSIGVFLIGLFMEQPLQFSAFPAVVLVATLLRLSLNVATTRLILLKGHEGHGAAGRVVETFGRIIVGGNVVVGLVIFLILVVINFVVITKGAGRVAEVAARFALDGMPGKQMAIDADLNSGNISADIARGRRKDLEREADFFGAMDGASKFVKGDAIAGLLITFINLVGGLMIGLSRGMTLSSAAETFSILSVGDALVSQIPALMISTAAGVVVTRSATGDQLGRALQKQMLGSRRAVAATAGVLTLFALLPGMPALPFLGLAGLLGLSVRAAKRKEAAEANAAASAPKDPAKKPGSSEEIDAALPLDIFALEVGYELVGAVDPQMGGKFGRSHRRAAQADGARPGHRHSAGARARQLAAAARRVSVLDAGHRNRPRYDARGSVLGDGRHRQRAADRRRSHERSSFRYSGALDPGPRSRAGRSARLHGRRSHDRHRHALVRGRAHERAQYSRAAPSSRTCSRSSNAPRRSSSRTWSRTCSLTAKCCESCAIYSRKASPSATSGRSWKR